MAIARRHHFVPKFLMQPWVREDPRGNQVLSGWYWDHRTQAIALRRRGAAAFCCQLDLLMLKKDKLRTDILETRFFQAIDSVGASVRDALVAGAQSALSAEQRSDFARLMLSLEARRPSTVDQIRKRGTKFLAESLDGDQEVREAFAAAGIATTPAAYYESEMGVRLEDQAMLSLQQLVENPVVGRRLINAHWYVRDIDQTSGTLILSDRPLLRFHAFDSEGAVWLLPLTPWRAFIAANHALNLERLIAVNDRQFAKKLNVSSAAQADRFVFAIPGFGTRWLQRYLKRGLSAWSHPPDATPPFTGLSLTFPPASPHSDCFPGILPGKTTEQGTHP
jgi:hypothetical protein